MGRYNGSVAVTGFIAPTDTQDTYPTHDSVLGRGGLREVQTIAERNAISADRRRVGMLVYVKEDTNYYALIGDITNLSWRNLGSSLGGGDELREELAQLEEDLRAIELRTTALEKKKRFYEMSISIPSTVEPSEVLMLAIMPYDFDAAIGSKCMALAKTPDDATLTIQSNGVDVGTITFVADRNTGIVEFDASARINKGNLVTIIAPDTATLIADVAIYFTFTIRELT